MNLKPVLYAVMAMTFATAGSAIAQGNSRNDNCRDGSGRCGPQDMRPGNNARPNNHARPNSLARRPYAQPYRAQPYRYDPRDERGAGPDHSFRRGGHLPQYYRGRQYVVDDWRGHHLSAPPRGYHWVQTGGDYVLVAITTGLILQLLLNN